MARNAFNPARGEPPAIQFLSVDRLEVDATYQRSIEGRSSQKLIEAIARDWDWHLCVPLLVSARDGKLYIVDGQHRHAAAVMRGDIPHLPCCVGQYASAAEEAALFIQANRRRRAVNKIDDFRAALAGGDPATVRVNELVTDARLTIASHGVTANIGPGELVCTSTLYRMLAKQGAPALSAALTCIGDAFEGQIIRYGSLLVQGLTFLFKAPPEGFDPDLCLDTLNTMTADEWGEHPTVTAEHGGPNRSYALKRAIISEMAALSLSEAA